MKKTVFIFVCFLAMALPSLARHIKGGEIYYQDLGPGATINSERYFITLRLFVSCDDLSPGQLENSVNIGITYSSNDAPAPGSPFTFPLTSDKDITLSSPNPCIVNPSPVCYRIRIFSSTVELPRTPEGYDLVFERCCRIDGITNVNPNSNIGAAYTCHMHGTYDIGVNATNSSPQFLVRDTVLICQNRPFSLNFGAVDMDKDSLSYQFAPAYLGGDANGGSAGVVTNPAPPSQLLFANYANGFSGTQPLGTGVTVDPVTGLIAGIAPSAGNYVVCVLLKEWRNGANISQHRKDFIIHVDERCDFAAATLKPSYTSCKSLSYTFHNEAPPSTLIHTYSWDFGVPGLQGDTSDAADPSFTFPDSGAYTVKLIINKGQDCSDSAKTLLKIYPGFHPGFTVTGTCMLAPIQFKDTTQTRYGKVSGWVWNFGDETTAADTSFLQNPSWKYSSTGNKKATLIVGSTKGCLDTVYQTVSVLDKPVITLPFRDTLICSIDTLQLHALGNGSFSWSPNTFIQNGNSPDPFVFPPGTTSYQVTLNQNGCLNTDSIHVRVVDFVTVGAGNDTLICLSDTITLHTSGDGLNFLWSPGTTLDRPDSKTPKAFPTGATLYTVIASIGKCNARANVNVRTVPYPASFAGTDTTICYGDTAQLHASMNGETFSWTPTASLNDASILAPKAYPLSTTIYTLSVGDNLGCPKPGISRIAVNVEAQIHANGGNDTTIVVGQPLQLHASGAPFFSWWPARGLNHDNIPAPIAILNDTITYFLKAFDNTGCFGLDTIHIKVFKTAPDILVPNAFTPGKNTNSIFRPVTPGIASLEFFRVYNRWGQLVFSTAELGKGWDGATGSRIQASGTYVWMVCGKDYTGKLISKKGVVVLIR